MIDREALIQIIRSELEHEGIAGAISARVGMTVADVLLRHPTARAALAENGESEPVRQEWYESRSGLLDRFCDIDTSDWDEGDFFRFLEKPWQFQYEVASVRGRLGDRRPGA